MFKGSWKTTVTGLLMLVAGVFALKKGLPAAWAAGDAVGIMPALTGIFGGLGLMFARDNDKSSEAVGADARERQGEKEFPWRPLTAVVWLALPAALLLGGCAVNRTRQLDAYVDKQGQLNKRETTTTTLSFWDAISKMGGFKATQSDRTQATSIATTESASTSSNLVTITGNAVELGKVLRLGP